MKQKNTERIEQYLEGKLSEQERLSFELEAEQKPELKQELALYRDILIGANFHFSSELKEKLKLEEKRNSGKLHDSSGRQKRFFIVLGLAASFLLLLLAGYWWVNADRSPEELYAANYQPYPNIINPVERSGALPESSVDRAMISYERGNYQQAIDLFTQEGTLSSDHQFYLALSYLETGAAENAAQLLDEVVASNNKTFYLPALWYQAMSFLAAKQPQQAEQILQKLLQEEESTYHPQARDVLDEL